MVSLTGREHMIMIELEQEEKMQAKSTLQQPGSASRSSQHCRTIGQWPNSSLQAFPFKDMTLIQVSIILYELG